ncbi:MAG: NAD(P)-dependent oxidoreductase [Elusimicrobiales bacterium]|nr:NAD(P)-dependent oxidoreductase [Elusimicrobiales bacterium]
MAQEELFLTMSVKPETVLITGAAGFIGSRVAAHLLEAGFNVIGLERPGCDLFRVKRLLPRVKVYRLPGEKASSVLRKEKIDGIIHLATYYRKRHAPADVGPMMRTNIEMPALLLEAAVAAGVKWFINTGTFFECELPRRGPLKETAPIAPWNLYASTKTAFDGILKTYAASGAMKAMTIRLFSPYGPNDNPDKVIPYLVSSLLRGDTVKLAGPLQKLSFIYVDDIADAYLKAAGKAGSLRKHETVNIGGGKSHDVLEVIRTLEAVSGGKLAFTLPPGKARGPKPPVFADLRKARSLLGWRPRYDIRRGLKLTFDSCRNAALSGRL